MEKKMPTFSICNLLGSDRCMTEVFVIRLRKFVDKHPGMQFPHRHNFYQIVLFTQGGGQHSIDFQQYEVQPHQIYYMAPGQIHTWEFDDETDGYLINFNDSFFTSVVNSPQYVRDFPLFNHITRSSVNTLDLACCTEVEQAFAQMLEEFEAADNYLKMELLRGILTIILVRLSRAAPLAFKDGTSKHHVAQLRQFEQLIEQHFREKRLPKDYAKMMFVTPNHLNALTNSAIGKSAGEIIRARTLLEAKRLLTNSDLMVGQIAETLHFEDNAYFTRFFKKHLGITPEGFRAVSLQAEA